ncbi:hypothetical protein BDF20DRAFT_808257, partial [Mycotypha africana]|uniref:uncharacterized protein n=1 Tax=Mycotypha africana TaxID=64632 RepID=UPI002300A950
LQANKHELRFLNLTCYLTEEERDYKNEENYSTHDSAETMIYAYVDTHPTVADLIWKKRQLKQSEFLSL